MQLPLAPDTAAECLPVCPSAHLSGKEWISVSREELEADLCEVKGDALLPILTFRVCFGDQS